MKALIETTKAAAREQHEQAMASLPEDKKASRSFTTQEQVLANDRFRIYTSLRAKNTGEQVGQIETNADLKGGIVRETLISYHA